MKKAKLESILCMLCKEYGVVKVELELANSFEYPLSEMGSGYYLDEYHTIVLELNNPTDRERYSDQYILDSLAHEFVHHLEYTKIGKLPSHRGKFADLVRKTKRLIKEFDSE